MLFLWDIDGTLIQGKGAGRRAMNKAFMRNFNIEDAFDSVQMAGGLDLDFIESVFARYHIGHSFLTRFLAEYYSTLDAEMRVGAARVVPGVRDVVQRLTHNPKFYHALGTGNLEQGARIKLQVFDLNEYFPIGGFCEGARERYQVLQMAIERATEYYGMQFRPEDVLVIGDTIRDIEAARKVGAKVLSVTTGGNTYDELQAASPDWLVRDLRDMPVF